MQAKFNHSVFSIRQHLVISWIILCVCHFILLFLTFISQENLSLKMNEPAFSNPWDLWSDLQKLRNGSYSVSTTEKDWTVTGKICVETGCVLCSSPQDLRTTVFVSKCHPWKYVSQWLHSCQLPVSSFCLDQIVSPVLQVERLQSTRQEKFLLLTESRLLHLLEWAGENQINHVTIKNQTAVWNS